MTLTVPVAVTVSPSSVGRLHQAAEVDGEIVLGVGAVIGMVERPDSVNVHAPVAASSAIVNTVSARPGRRRDQVRPDDVAQRNAARSQPRRQRAGAVLKP